MTLPAWREDRPAPRPASRPRAARPADISALPDTKPQAASPAKQLLAMVEAAAERGGLHRPRPHAGERHTLRRPARQKLAGMLLGWSCLIMAGSVGYLAYETVRPAPAAEDVLPGLDFSGVASRYVQSSEGPAVELSGVVRNAGETLIDPQVTIQLAGRRVAVEEQLRLGGAALPPGAERPFTVRVLLPEGTRTVRLLSLEETQASPRGMALVSPAWTAPRL